MKKNDLVILAIVALLVAVVVVLKFNKNVNIDENNTTNMSGESYVPPKSEHIDIEGWENDFNSNNKVVTIIGLTSCPHCRSYKPVATKFSEEYGFKLYFFEMDTMYYDELTKIKGYLGIEGDLGYFPSTFITEGGKVLVQQPGYAGELQTADFYREYGLIQ